MRRHILLIIAISFTVFIPVALYAQTTTVTALAELGASLGIESTPGELSFGKLSCSNTPGTCNVSTRNVLSTTGGVSVSSGNPTAAIFTVTGKNGASYNITLPGSSVLLTHADGIHSMSVSNFSIETQSNGLSPTGTINATTGVDVLIVGATLNTQSAQFEGRYSGTFTVIVSYN